MCNSFTGFVYALDGARGKGEEKTVGGYGVLVHFSRFPAEWQCPYELTLVKSEGPKETRLGHRYLLAEEDPVEMLVDWMELWGIQPLEAWDLRRKAQVIYGFLLT